MTDHVSQGTLIRLRDKASALHEEVMREVVAKSTGPPSLPVRQVAEVSANFAKSLATCLDMMAIEADPSLRQKWTPPTLIIPADPEGWPDESGMPKEE